MKKAGSVDEYLALAPEPVQERLKEIRKLIKQVAPKAEEKISYGMPYYGYKGRLVYFAYFKKHIGVYITPPIVAKFAKELKEYKSATATIQLPYNKKLPLALLKKMIKARVKLNDESEKKS